MNKMNLKWIILSWVCCLTLYSCAGSKKATSTKSNSNNTTTESKTVDRKALVNYARTFMGIPYKYGGNTPKEGFDCSGYVKYVYNNFNVHVPRVTRDYAQFGNKIDLSKVKLGDLILFSLYDDKNTIGHIGIVSNIEKDKVFFLHAASGKKTRKVMESELAGVHLSRMLFITRVL